MAMALQILVLVLLPQLVPRHPRSSASMVSQSVLMFAHRIPSHALAKTYFAYGKALDLDNFLLREKGLWSMLCSDGSAPPWPRIRTTPTGHLHMCRDQHVALLLRLIWVC